MPVVPISQNRVGIASVDGTKLVAPDLSGTGLQVAGAAAESVARGIGEVRDVAEHNAAIYDEAAVRQADNQNADSIRTATLTGDNAFYKLTGADAIGAAKPTMDGIKSASMQIAASLKTDRQRRMYAELADRRLQTEADAIAKHADVNLGVYNQSQSASRIALASDNAVSFADDPARFADEMAVVGHEVDAQTKGMPPEQRQLEHLKAVSGVGTRIVDAKMTADPVGAAAYYQEHKDQFTPGDALAVEKALHGPLVERAAKAAADNAVAVAAGGAPAADPYAEFPIVINPDKSTWDKRGDGSEKGTGFLGLRRRPDGTVSSELSIGVEWDGKEHEIPTMVPGLTKGEMHYLMTTSPDDQEKSLPESIKRKAVAFAKSRIAAGLSPFKQPNEGDYAPVATAPIAALPIPASGGGSPLARMTAITLHAESRGQDYTNGHLTTSSAGAQAAMQTMPGTQRDPGFGVKPAQDGSVAEMNRVGRDYLAAMMTRYGGDPAKAWAAYNGGPGRVDAAVAGHGAGWLGAMPAETQGYVRQNVAMLGGGAAGVDAAPAKDNLKAAYAYIQSQHLPFDVEQAAMSEIDRRVARDDHVVSRQQDAAKDQAYTTIDRLGPNGFTSINQLPADVRRNISPEVYHSLMEQAAQNAKPKAIAENGPAALQMKVLAASDPATFAKLDLRPMQPFMAPGEFASLAVDQAKMRANPAGESVMANIRSEIDTAIKFYGKGVVDDAVSARKSPDGLVKYGRISDAMRLYLDRATDNGARKPTDDDMKRAFDQATMQVTVRGGGWFGSDAKMPAYKVPDGANIEAPIPPSTRLRIIAAFKKNGNPNPDEAAISDAYERGKDRKGLWD